MFVVFVTNRYSATSRKQNICDEVKYVWLLNIHAKIFELPDEKLDLVLLRIPAHVPELLVLVARDDFVHGSRDPIRNGYFRLVGGAKFKLPLVVLRSVK